MNGPSQSLPPSGPTSAEGLEPPALGTAPELWARFVAAKTVETRSAAWLAILCADMPGACAGAVLIESVEAGTFVPLAVWPEGASGLGRLAGAVEDTLRARTAVNRAVEDAAGPERRHLAYPLLLGERIDGVVVVEVTCTAAAASDAMRRIHWGSAWLANLLGARELDEAIRGRERVASVLDALAVVLRAGPTKQLMFEIANDLRQRFNATRSAIGWVADAAVGVVALSDAANFDRRSPIVKAYREAMEEAYDRACALRASAGDGTEGLPAHQAMMATSGSGYVVTQPLMQGAEVVAVITLERDETGFSDADLLWLDAYAALAASAIAQRREADRSSAGRLYSECKRGLRKIFGPRHLVWKTASALALLLVAVLVLVPVSYRVTARTVIEGEIQRVVPAPFEGFVAAAPVRAGDSVKAGQLLAALDDRELKIELERWASERGQYEGRLREATAERDLAAVQVASAQLRQAEAQWALAAEKIERAQIRAPFEGIVVTGDLSQQVGAPVETGKKLFEIAPLASYRVILQVDERDIRQVAVGQPGRLVMTGIAGEAMDFSVGKVTPVATAQDGRNFFRVEAVLSDASTRLRPGMEGVSKVDVGRRSLWWILTHSLTDWLRLSLWTWLP